MRRWLVTLNRTAREGLIEKGIFESRPEGSDKRAIGVSWRRALQVEQLANSKALGLGCTWGVESQQRSHCSQRRGVVSGVISKGGAGYVGSWKPL